MQEKCCKIIKYYGNDNQILKAQEELSELSTALYHFVDGKIDKNELLGEIADVTVMLFQLNIMLGISPYELDKVVEYKINRTLEKMNLNRS